jgi:hypothetical protein
MGYQLTTNNVPHEILRLCDLPKKARRDFDYIDEDSEFDFRIVKYREAYYDLNDMQHIEPDSGRAHPMGWAYRVHPGEPLAHYDVILTDSYFSAVAFRLTVDDCGEWESAVCATIIS